MVTVIGNGKTFNVTLPMMLLMLETANHRTQSTNTLTINCLFSSLGSIILISVAIW